MAGELEGGTLDGFLRPGELALDKARRFEREHGMRVGMVADFMPGRGNFACNFGQPADVRADLKKGRGGSMAGEDFEQFRSRFAGPVVESERDGRPDTGAAMYGGREQRARRDSNSIGERTGGGDGRTAENDFDAAHGSRV